MGGREAGNDWVSLVREPGQNASEALTVLGEAHRGLDKTGLRLIRSLHPAISDLSTYLHKVPPPSFERE